VVGLCLPAAKLATAEPLSPSGAAFLLLALASVSFDGLARTFAWLGFIGVNPLEFPGRSALVGSGTAGLAATFLGFAALFGATVAAGRRLAGDGVGPAAASGLFVWSVVPIALAYHFAHYLTTLAVNAQYALAALSDPFALGWDLFGTAAMHVHAGIVAGAQSAWVIWNLQAAAIIAGHVVAVLAAHLFADRLYPDRAAAARALIPLTLLMIGYTVFGLWLLATPTVG